MREIALHLVDLAENSIGAHARSICIGVSEDFRTDRLLVSVEDDGCGMDAQTVNQAADPFFTSRTTRKVGLGIPLLKEQAEACNGRLSVSSRPDFGTKVEAVFQHSHIDRMPLGDLASTLLTLIVAHPDVHWTFRYIFTPPFHSAPRRYEFDDTPVKSVVEGLQLSHPDVLAYIREALEQGIAEARK